MSVLIPDRDSDAYTSDMTGYWPVTGGGWVRVDTTPKTNSFVDLKGNAIKGFSGGGSSSISSPVASSSTPIAAPAQVKQDYQQGDFDPWSKYRAGMGDTLANKTLAGDPSDIYRDKLAEMSTGQFNPNDPSYQWRFEQGQQALERSLASKGMLNSGNAAIELQQYGQQSASQEYGAQFDRMLKGLAGVSSQYDTQMQRLMAMAGVGLDPTAAAKVNIEGMKANTNLYNVAVDDATARYTAELNAATSRANTQVNAAAGIKSAQAGQEGSVLAAYAKMNQNNWEQNQSQAYQDALSSSLWFNGYGSIASGYGGMYSV